MLIKMSRVDKGTSKQVSYYTNIFVWILKCPFYDKKNFSFAFLDFSGNIKTGLARQANIYKIERVLSKFSVN